MKKIINKVIRLLDY